LLIVDRGWRHDTCFLICVPVVSLFPLCSVGCNLVWPGTPTGHAPACVTWCRPCDM